MPRGADAVVMVEHAEMRAGELRIARAVTPGSGVSFAGTDITAGETVLRRGQLLTSRDTGVLAAIGVAEVDVWRKPVVAILSTGDEIIAPGDADDAGTRLRLERAGAGRCGSGNRRRTARLGIVAGRGDGIARRLRQALEFADMVLLSGGTSKGAGDVSYRVVAELTIPDRRARRRAQAWQADLPRRHRRARRRRPPGFPRPRSSPFTSSWRRCCACWRAATRRSGPSCRRGWR